MFSFSRERLHCDEPGSKGHPRHGGKEHGGLITNLHLLPLYMTGTGEMFHRLSLALLFTVVVPCDMRLLKFWRIHSLRNHDSICLDTTEKRDCQLESVNKARLAQLNADDRKVVIQRVAAAEVDEVRAL